MVHLPASHISSRGAGQHETLRTKRSDAPPTEVDFQKPPAVEEKHMTPSGVPGGLTSCWIAVNWIIDFLTICQWFDGEMNCLMLMSRFTGKWIARCWITRHLPGHSSGILRVISSFASSTQPVPDGLRFTGTLMFASKWDEFGTQKYPQIWDADLLSVWPTPKLWNGSQCQSNCLVANSPILLFFSWKKMKKINSPFGNQTWPWKITHQ